MDFVILGFLMMRDLSQYDLLKALEQKVSPFYQSSLGSIQSALKKLENKGLITSRKDKESSRGRILYQITDSGKDTFVTMMKTPINENRYEVQISTKLFFMGLVDQQTKLAVTKAVIAFLSESIETFESAKAEHMKRDIPERYTELATYQFKTLELALYEQQLLRTWFEDLLVELET